MIANVVITDGEYGESDKALLARITQKVFFARKAGGEDIPWLPNRLILLCPEEEDYHTFVDRKSVWLQKNHGPTIVISPRPLENSTTVPCVDMSNFQRLAILLNMGVELKGI